MNKKNLILIIGIMVGLSLNTYARFYFQDNTLLNSVRVCTSINCENLQDSNISTITGITSAYEIGGDKLQVNTWNFLKDNLFMVIGLLLMFGLGIFILREVIKK